jgi:hypothetical protein
VVSLGEEALAEALRAHHALQVESGWVCACGWGRGEGRTAREWHDHLVAAALAALPAHVALLDVATLAVHWHDALWRYDEMASQTFAGEGCECVANARLVVAAAHSRQPFGHEKGFTLHPAHPSGVGAEGLDRHRAERRHD